MRQLAMVRFPQVNLADDVDVAAICAALTNGPARAEQLVAEVTEARRPFALRSLAWMVKLGLIKVVP
jgi:hypothetical protein